MKIIIVGTFICGLFLFFTKLDFRIVIGLLLLVLIVGSIAIHEKNVRAEMKKGYNKAEAIERVKMRSK